MNTDCAETLAFYPNEPSQCPGDPKPAALELLRLRASHLGLPSYLRFCKMALLVYFLLRREIKVQENPENAEIFEDD